jgi:hypothetical protein
MTALRVLVDGVALSDDEARAIWRRFSVWMDANVGDLAGFARSEGLASLHPEMHGTSAVLVASRTASQRPYTNAAKKRVDSSARPKPRGKRP